MAKDRENTFLNYAIVGLTIALTGGLYGLGRNLFAEPAKQYNQPAQVTRITETPKTDSKLELIADAPKTQIKSEVKPARDARDLTQKVNAEQKSVPPAQTAPTQTQTQEEIRVEPPKPKYSQEELEETRRILYAEAANQPSLNRRLIGRVILNRVASDKYPNTIHGVIYQTNAFSCIDDSSNPNWKQATGRKERNEYEEKVFQRCLTDAKAVLDGKKEGIPREEEIIAYHDISIDIKDLRSWRTKAEKRRADYWNSLEEVYRNDRLIFYAPKLKNSSK